MKTLKQLVLTLTLVAFAAVSSTYGDGCCAKKADGPDKDSCPMKQDCPKDAKADCPDKDNCPMKKDCPKDGTGDCPMKASLQAKAAKTDTAAKGLKVSAKVDAKAGTCPMAGQMAGKSSCCPDSATALKAAATKTQTPGGCCAGKAQNGQLADAAKKQGALVQK
jgi:hypothetical protein